MVTRSILRGAFHVALMLAAACAFSALTLRALMLRAVQASDNPDDRFSFYFLALVAFVFLGALVVLWRVVRSSRIHLVQRVSAILLLAFAASCSVVAGRGYVGWTFYWPAGQDVDGDFVVKKWSQRDWMDPPRDNTIEALYFRGREVTTRLDYYVRHPTQPSVVLFRRFESGNLPVNYAFDGRTFRTLRLAASEAVPWFNDQWSPDKTKLIWNDADAFYVFDVPRWRVSRLAGDAISPGQYHQPYYAGWSPASRHFAQIDHGSPPYPNSQPVVLREWDADTLTARTVGCLHHNRRFSRDDFSWQDESLVVPEQVRRDFIPCPESRR